jgi:hypothetical protein
MRGLEWFKTSDKLPPYDLKVLGWIACEACRKKENHAHPAVWHEWSQCDFYPVTLKEFSWENMSWEKSETGICFKPKEPIEVKKDNWRPYPSPSYWAYINPPNFEQDDE